MSVFDVGLSVVFVSRSVTSICLIWLQYVSAWCRFWITVWCQTVSFG